MSDEVQKTDDKLFGELEEFLAKWKMPEQVIGISISLYRPTEIHLSDSEYIRKRKIYKIRARNCSSYPYELSFFRNNIRYFTLLTTLNEKETEQWQRAGFQTLPAAGITQSLDFEDF